MDYVTIYSQDGKLLGVLENADEVSYSLVHNDLWTASFSLPTDDPKNALCEAHNIVRIPESGRDIGLYRIIGMPTGEMEAAGGVKTYSLEHVMATLLDDVLFGYHEIGGLGVTTHRGREHAESAGACAAGTAQEPVYLLHGVRHRPDQFDRAGMGRAHARKAGARHGRRTRRLLRGPRHIHRQAGRARQSGGGHSHTVNSHNHSFSGSQSVADGHYHNITNPGTSKATAGVSINATHSISISGTTGNRAPGTDSAGGHSHTVDSHAHSMTHGHSVTQNKHLHSVEL